ncbi:hypothetical protein ACLI4U_04495 [Natrialbaceae archaeon A-CW2]
MLLVDSLECGERRQRELALVVAGDMVAVVAGDKVAVVAAGDMVAVVAAGDTSVIRRD